MECLADVLARVCGQDPCWVLGGEALPFCQRCTGLYVGAAVAAVLSLLFRPRPTNLSLGTHGLLLLLMVPFGYHLVPQNGVLRTLTGQLFAVGLVCYLSLLPGSRLGRWPRKDRAMPRAHAAGVLASLVIVQWTVHVGGRLAGAVLTWSGLVGLVVLAVLATANLLLLPLEIRRVVRSTRVAATS